MNKTTATLLCLVIMTTSCHKQLVETNLFEKEQDEALFIALRKDDPELARYWELCWGMRPHDELYTAADGPDCIRNVAADAELQLQLQSLRQRLFDALRAQGDPRMAGRGWVFDCLPYFGTPHVDQERFAEREYNYYQKRLIAAGQTPPAMNAVGDWARWV